MCKSSVANIGGATASKSTWGNARRLYFDAVATVRDAIAYAEKTQTPLCVLSLDFMEALARISHIYLFKLL